MRVFIKHIFLIIGIFLAVLTSAQKAFNYPKVSRCIVTYNDTINCEFLLDSSIYWEQWDTLPQSIFWKKAMDFSPDTALVNVANNRQLLSIIPSDSYLDLTKENRQKFKDSLVKAYELTSEDTLVYITSGRNHYYNLKKAAPGISDAIKIFENQGVDPWYAQTILLTESPGSLRESTVGAYGEFQLMKYVARKYGLTVTKTVDERKDLKKSAVVAAKFIQKICIPETKRILRKYSIEANEESLTFRLLVLHCYHAGSGNVEGVMRQIRDKTFSQELIKQVWQTTYKSFQNASQNYSQVSLASNLRFNEILMMGDTIHQVNGDLMLKSAPSDSSFYSGNSKIIFYTSCLSAYENDILRGAIPLDYFLKKVKFIEQELKQDSTGQLWNFSYPMNEYKTNQIGLNLLNRGYTFEAVKLFEMNAKAFPDSWNVYDSLAMAMKEAGETEMAITYYEKSLALNPENNGAKRALKKLKTK